MKDQFIYYISKETNNGCIYDKLNYITYHPNKQLGGWGNDLIKKYNKRTNK